MRRPRRPHLRLGQALAGVPGLRPLFAELPESVVRYVFPVAVGDPGAWFGRLKNHGVSIVRFGEIESRAGACAKPSQADENRSAS